ncbi:MAG: tripartite tricarboxylate transporter substrate binding protein [Ideonella sp.]
MHQPALAIRHLMTALAAFVLLGSAHAAWPDRPIHIIVPYPPGGPSDIVLRSAAEKMQSSLKQPVLLDNKPGAGGNIGAAAASRAAPDGYTWFFAVDTQLTVNPHIYRSLGFKVEDLVPVSVASTFSQTLVCNPSVGVKTVPELVKAAKSSKLNYASGGAGVPGHLAMELLLSVAHFDMQHIPYKGPAPAAQDVIGGQVACGFLAGPTVLPHIRSGRLVALAVSGATRSPVLPDVPTVAESGYPGYDASFKLVLFAPRGTPEPVITAMHKAFVEALREPDMATRLAATDQVIVAGTPADAAALITVTSRKWAEIVKRIGLTID